MYGKHKIYFLVNCRQPERAKERHKRHILLPHAFKLLQFVFLTMSVSTRELLAAEAELYLLNVGFNNFPMHEYNISQPTIRIRTHTHMHKQTQLNRSLQLKIICLNVHWQFIYEGAYTQVNYVDSSDKINAELCMRSVERELCVRVYSLLLIVGLLLNVILNGWSMWLV